MGRRLRTLWHLRDRGRAPGSVLVAPARALVQRLGPAVDDFDPIIVGPGDQLDSTAARRDGSARSAIAANIRWSTAASSPCADRSSTCSPRRPTRRCASTCGAMRSIGCRSSPSTISGPRSASPKTIIFPCRELLPDDDVRARAEELMSQQTVGSRAVGAACQRRAVRRHGVVAPLARRRRGGAVRPRGRLTRSWCSSSRNGCVIVRLTSSAKRPILPRRSPAHGMSSSAMAIACLGCMWVSNDFYRTAMHLF